MRRWLERLGYRICGELAYRRVCKGWPAWLENAWVAIWYRCYCPRPVIDNWTARACIAGGHCGCSNGPQHSGEEKR